MKTERMGDVELVLRFVAMYETPRGKGRSDNQTLDDFLNATMEHLNLWDQARWLTVRHAFQKSMVAAKAVFGRNAFRKVTDPPGWRSPINRGLFEAESVALARLTEPDLGVLAGRGQAALKALATALRTDSDFANALLYGTGSAPAANVRLKTVEKMLYEVINA